MFCEAGQNQKFGFNCLYDKLNQLKSLVDGAEQEFANAVYDFVIKNDPAATDWQPFKHDKEKRKQLLKDIGSASSTIGFATDYAFVVYNLLMSEGNKLEMTEPQIQHYIQWVVDTYPAPIRLFKNVFENVVNSNFPINENSRANFVWDIQLMFGVGQHSIGNEKLYFVTADKAMVQAAVQEGAYLSIYTLPDYLDYLGVTI